MSTAEQGHCETVTHMLPWFSLFPSCSALAPTLPFAKWLSRYRIASVLVPALLSTLVLNAHMIWAGTTFGIGIGMFGQPVFDRMKPEAFVAFLDRVDPHWRSRTELRNWLLVGIPTNAQLALTLLRIGEANSSPLPPPPPTSAAPPPSARKGVAMADHPDLPEDQRAHLAKEAARQETAEEEQSEKEQEVKKKGKKTAMALTLFKGGVKIGVETLLGANRVKASIGSLQAKARIGVIQDPNTAEKRRLGDGPISFRARHKGKPGLIFISTHATSPCISFERVGFFGKPKSETTKLKHKIEGREEARDKDDPSVQAQEAVEIDPDAQQSALFSIAVDDIAEIRKKGGLNWVSKVVVGWALGSEVADGLEIVDSTGTAYKLTAVNRRDEAFNRLVAIGKQKWELF